MDFTPYLNFDGTCEEAFNFYAKLFNGKILMMMKHGDMPPGNEPPPEWGEKIVHARLEANGRILMGSDAPPVYAKKPQGFAVSVLLDTPEEADRVYAGLADGAVAVDMPIQETFWAQRFAMLTDRFGIPWMINCEKRG
ncbi:VOC family protein [Silvimonas iriomotensis]|uniref:VOC family protein n=1 Tax=Silvimonas iriomotensis TaxID=449662 RepID=A0ABQ2P755_9NEIS|nr:VOC family protein [Silvimonas iriomotensis]GGP19957.1 VOC family protein [Silvimonas iriomotensis]